MNNELFQQAKVAALSLDYNRALDLYNHCLTDPTYPLQPGEVGMVYHQIGNCLTKLKSYYEAIEAYLQAIGDPAYDAVGAVNCNLGMAYAALRDFPSAVKHFEVAVSDQGYPTPYKAYLGMGTALLKQGKSAEAGVAFREAALDEANPDPTKALLNLGVCFMALNRPDDAVVSYESALQFDMSQDTRNKMYASLGQAYTASGRMEEAVDAFEKAIADRTYFLSDSASVDYQRAVTAVAHGNAESTQVIAGLADTSGIDIGLDGSMIADQDPYVVSGEVDEDYYFADQYSNHGISNEDRFFNSTDEELEQWSRGMVKLERKRRSVGLKVVLVIVILLLVLLGAGLVLFSQGFGIPSQETVVENVFSNPGEASNYANGVTSESIESFNAIIPENATVSIDGINKSMSTSTAYVTATTQKGGQVTYEVSLVRDMLGWKVSDVNLYFVSQN